MTISGLCSRPALFQPLDAVNYPAYLPPLSPSIFL